ncbi:inovirus-type Gp2 protein [uncultured Pseudacidovorax sp.]|uniref:YagK/YfjJ domain-containing protein n=1 Tax=uncultured Pseudacidovorax sp. TaxID=679313 RepID=UPI0025D459E4|nr:inovirus-type Gp2 protein [uncultured Pseudacidovorax sp.]
MPAKMSINFTEKFMKNESDTDAVPEVLRPADRTALLGSDSSLLRIAHSESQRGYCERHSDQVLNVIRQPDFNVLPYANILDLMDEALLNKTAGQTEEKKYFVKGVNTAKFSRLTYPDTFYGLQPDFHWSPKIKLFKECCEELGLSPSMLKGFSGMQAKPVWEALIVLIRKRARKPEFKAAMRRIEQRRNYHAKKFRTLVTSMFEKYAKICCIRVDLGVSAKNASGVSAEQMKKWMKQFKNNWRTNSAFENLVAYAICYECGVQHGVHCHCTFFFDGSKVRHDVFHADRIIQYWETTITKGKGLGFNCNHKKAARYRRVGIGNIHHSETQKIEDLLFAMSYFYKTQTVLVPNPIAGIRTIEHTQASSLRRGVGGRPRKGANNASPVRAKDHCDSTSTKKRRQPNKKDARARLRAVDGGLVGSGVLAPATDPRRDEGTGFEPKLQQHGISELADDPLAQLPLLEQIVHSINGTLPKAVAASRKVSK